MNLIRRSILLGGGAVAATAALNPAFAKTDAAARSGPMRVVRLDPELDAVIAPDARITRVATGFKFTEGPMWRQGRLWFSDLGGDQMLAVSPDGKVELLIDHSGGYPNPPPHSNLGSNAMATDKDGSVLMIRQGGRTIV